MKMNIKHGRCVLGALAAVTVLLCTPSYAQQYTIKFATVAPEGTTWMIVMRDYDAAIRKESGGRIGFKFYPGMVQGDEKTVVRKIAVGQLQAGGFTGVGVGEIAKKVRLFDAPFLIQSSAEAEDLYEKFDPEVRQAFASSGYELLRLVEIGFVYMFSETPIYTPEDLRQQKMWVWEGDPVAETAFDAIGLRPIPLSADNVFTSLQTGLINAFYSTPYACVSLQWYTQAKYMVDYPLTFSTGAVVISKKYFDNLPDDLKEILTRNGNIYLKKLSEMIYKDNEEALQVMKKRGIVFTKADPKVTKQYIESGIKARRMLIGKLYDESFMKRVEKEVDDFRKSHSKK
jgi:TRAP-type C4-dicarboxylate transport system substrate-binding protein